MHTPAGGMVSLAGWYAGRSCFLLGGGPSLGRANLSLLRQRGIVTMAMNNAWVTYRPNLWIGMDTPGHFPDGGWRDPGIIKFIPRDLFDFPIRVRMPDGSVRRARNTVRQMPAVMGYDRRTGFDPAKFFQEEAVCTGNGQTQTDALGLISGRSVMLAAMRVLVYLGFSRIFLAGCDFRMDPATPYAFHQPVTEREAATVNQGFAAANQRLQALRPALEALGVRVGNTTPQSGLTAFEHVPFTDAVREAGAECALAVTMAGWAPPPLRVMTEQDWQAGQAPAAGKEAM
jgi:hypothetical protein